MLNLFWGDFLGKNCPVHPGGSKLGKTSKNRKTFQFFKMPKKRSEKQSNMFWACFEIMLLVKILPSAPWRVETWKNLGKREKISFFFQIAQNRSQKCSNTFSTCFEVTFLVKFLLSAPWRFERRKDWKKTGKFQYF